MKKLKWLLRPRRMARLRYLKLKRQDPVKAFKLAIALIIGGMLAIALLFFGSAMLLCMYGHSEYVTIHIMLFILWFAAGLCQMYPNGMISISRVPSRLDEMLEQHRAVE